MTRHTQLKRNLFARSMLAALVGVAVALPASSSEESQAAATPSVGEQQAMASGFDAYGIAVQLYLRALTDEGWKTAPALHRLGDGIMANAEPINDLFANAGYLSPRMKYVSALAILTSAEGLQRAQAADSKNAAQTALDRFKGPSLSAGDIKPIAGQLNAYDVASELFGRANDARDAELRSKYRALARTIHDQAEDINDVLEIAGLGFSALRHVEAQTLSDAEMEDVIGAAKKKAKKGGKKKKGAGGEGPDLGVFFGEKAAAATAANKPELAALFTRLAARHTTNGAAINAALERNAVTSLRVR